MPFFGDVGLSELLLIVLVAVVVLKPEDVPVVMHKAGVVVAHVRHYVNGMWLGFKEKMEMGDGEEGR